MSVSIWVVDDDRSIRWVLEKALGQEGYAAVSYTHLTLPTTPYV